MSEEKRYLLLRLPGLFMENSIKVQVPISVSYPALEAVLKKKMLGEFIAGPEKGSQESAYAQIQDIGMAGSQASFYDVTLKIKISIIRTVLKRDNVDLLVVASLGYDNDTQQLFVRKFNLTSKTSSGFFNTALEVLANKVAYNQIIKKARVNIKEIISKGVHKANSLLESGLELKGVKLLGAVEMVQVQDITFEPERVSLLLELQANMEAEIIDLANLLPDN